MKDSFQNKNAIVTGAGQGIGFEIAQELLENGANVLLNDFDANILKKAQSQLGKWDGNYIIHQGDASNKADISEMITTIVGVFGSLDLAVANAGITIAGPFLEFSEEDLLKMFQLNLVGSFMLAQASAQQMINQNAGGRVLFLSSVTGIQAHKNLEGYGMTKAALQMLAKTLATELAPNGITVNCVAPGATETERTMQVPGYAEGWSEVIPTGRPSTTQDIAKACMYFLGPHSDQVTGQTLVVDGGWTATGPLPDAV
jgi:glucose 1-dehydrogenase